MSKLNKSAYIIAAIKRYKKPKSTVFVFDLVIAKKSKYTKLFVIEKIGSIDYRHNKMNINFFRLIFWMQYYPAVNPKAWTVLNKYIINRKW